MTDAERQKRYRDRKRNESVTEIDKSVTVAQESVTLDKYPAIVLALADPVKREKIQRITASLKGHSGVDMNNIRYEVYGHTFKTIYEVIAG